MERIKRIGSILWGIIYITGGLVATIIILPLILMISIFNIIKQEG